MEDGIIDDVRVWTDELEKAYFYRSIDVADVALPESTWVRFPNEMIEELYRGGTGKFFKRRRSRMSTRIIVWGIVLALLAVWWLVSRG